jgi:hypothetical protein
VVPILMSLRAIYLYHIDLKICLTLYNCIPNDDHIFSRNEKVCIVECVLCDVCRWANK